MNARIPLRRPRERHLDDRGFTLVELLIAVVIIGVITFPLGNLVIAYFKNTTDTQARTSLAHDMQIAAAYFAQDVASTGLRNTDLSAEQSVWFPTTSGAPISCGSGITPFLALAWDDYNATRRSTAESVYGTRTVDNAGTPELQLVRKHCAGGSSSPDSTAVLAHNLAATPTVACGDPPACTSITMSLSLRASSGNLSSSIDLIGTRRQS